MFLKELLMSDNIFNITIAGRLIGVTEPPYVIAELSANHNGSLERALQTIAEAKKKRSRRGETADLYA